MNTFVKTLTTLCGAWILTGCVSMADYQVALANDGSFAAYDKQFVVDPMDYPVYALNGSESKQHPEVGPYKGSREWTTDILPSDRWEITRLVHGRYLAYSEAYGERYCKQQLSARKGIILKSDVTSKCDDPDKARNYVDSYFYLYMRGDGVVYGWQQVRNNKRAPFEKTWFEVSNKGDWSVQPWFKCVDRCDKLGNMK